ncbi:MAG: tetratricopeptide repeat protein [Planctomycetaceae bacterium]|nr:tetratricopeptide repeat protein [Planctomycetaceae bacterium]
MTKRSLANGWTGFCFALSAALLAAGPAPAQETDAKPAPVQEVKSDAAMKQLMAASGLFDKGLYKMAITEYEAFLAKYPTHEKASAARYGLAVCHYRLKPPAYAEAAKALNELVKDKKFSQRDEALAVLGHCLLATKQNEQALAAFDDLLENHAKSKHAELAALNRAQVLFLLERPKDSLAACEKFLKDFSGSSRKGAAEYFMACSQSALKDYAGSEKTLGKFISDNKSSSYAADATLLLGQAMENQNKLDGAAEQYRSFLKIAPDPRKGEGYYSLGLALYKAGKFADAVTELSTAVSKYGSDSYAPAARLQLGLAQLGAGQIADARKMLEQVVANDPQRSRKAAYWLAQCDMTEKKHDAARQALLKLAAMTPPPENLPAIQFDAALCAMEMGQFEVAAKEFASFAEKNSGHAQAPDAMYRQAFCLHKLTQFDASNTLCEKILKGPASSVTTPTTELSAENLFLMSKHADAAKLFEKLMAGAQGARQQRLSLRLGQCAFLAGDYKKAATILAPIAADAAAAKDENLREAAFYLGDAQIQLQQYAPAAKSLETYIASGGTLKEEATFKLGLSHSRAGHTDKAEKTLATLIDQPLGSPWVARSLLAYGQLAYQKLKQSDKAADALNKVLDPKAKAPADVLPAAMFLLGWIDFDAKKYDAAAARFGKLVADYPKDALAADAALQQGICAKESGKTDEAIKLLKTFISSYDSSPRVNEARFMLAECLAKSNKHAEAIEIFNALADKKQSVSDVVLYNLAWSQRAAKDNAKAVTAYKQLLSQFPGSKLISPTRTELAELLCLDKKFSEAAALAEKVLADRSADAKTKAIAQYRLGLCYNEMSEPSKCAKAFAEFLKTYPDNDLVPAAMYQAGVACTAAGELDKAEEHYTTLIKKFENDKLVPVARLKLGEVQATNGNYKASAATYQDFLDKHKGNEYGYLARFGIGWAMENQKKYDDARTWYTAVIEAHNGETAARAQFQIGECYFAQAKYAEAARELLKVDIVYAYPQWSCKALYEAGRAFEYLKQYDEARAQYTTCAEKYKDQDSTALAKKRLDNLPGANQNP